MDTANTVQWRDIPGYGGTYQLAADGSIRSFRARGGLSETPHLIRVFPIRASAQRFVKLYDLDGNPHSHKVADLVAQTYLGGIPDGMMTTHKNGDVTDNSAQNIAIIPATDWRYHYGRPKRPVVRIDIHGKILERYPSTSEAAAANHMSIPSVSDRCNGRIIKEFASDGTSFRWAE